MIFILALNSHVSFKEIKDISLKFPRIFTFCSVPWAGSGDPGARTPPAGIWMALSCLPLQLAVQVMSDFLCRPYAIFWQGLTQFLHFKILYCIYICALHTIDTCCLSERKYGWDFFCGSICRTWLLVVPQFTIRCHSVTYLTFLPHLPSLSAARFRKAALSRCAHAEKFLYVWKWFLSEHTFVDCNCNCYYLLVLCLSLYWTQLIFL